MCCTASATGTVVRCHLGSSLLTSHEDHQQVIQMPRSHGARCLCRSCRRALFGSGLELHCNAARRHEESRR